MCVPAARIHAAQVEVGNKLSQDISQSNTTNTTFTKTTRAICQERVSALLRNKSHFRIN